MKTSASRETLQHFKNLRWPLAALLVTGILASAWILDLWTSRVSHSVSFSRNALWTLESPTTPAPSVFLRVQDTSYWAERSVGVIASNSYISTAAAGARLTDPTTSAAVRLAPGSTAALDRRFIKPIEGMMQIQGPLRVQTEAGTFDIPSGATKLIYGTRIVAPLSPALGSIHDLQKTGRIEFSWQKFEDPSISTVGARLEFARDSEFKTVLFSSMAENSQNLFVDFSDRAPGTWFVRLTVDSEILAVTSFQLVEAQTPDRLRKLGRRWISWRDRGEALLYRVDFSPDQSFQNVGHSFQVRQRQFDLTLVPAGLHFVRVSSVDLDGRESTSQPLSIEVQDRNEILRAGTDLNDPDLKLLARGWKILLNNDEMSRLREGYVILRESELRGIRIADSVARSFRQNTSARELSNASTGKIIFEVARDQNFSNPERVKPDPQGELLPPALPLGVLFARLRRIDEDGSLGAAGPASRLTTLLPAPKALPLITTRLKDSQGADLVGVELRWSLRAPVEGFELRVSTDADFNEAATRVMRTRQASRKIAAPGIKKFFWTVTAINSAGQPVSVTSKVQEVKVPEPPRLKLLSKRATAPSPRAPAMVAPLRPELLFPAEDAVIVGGARATTYGKLKWDFNSKNSNERFEIQIATDGDFVNVIEKKKLKTRDYTLRGDLPEGALFWRVRKEASKEWSSARRFELVYE